MKERKNFIARWKRYQIWDGNKKLAQFEEIGDYGQFSTDDDKLVSKLKKYKTFGKDFYCLEDSTTLPSFHKLNTHIGVMTSTHRQPDPEKVKANAKAEAQLEAAKQWAEIKPKVKKLGELEGKWLKNDGTFRADAPEGVKEEYSKLKQEIGEI